MVRQRLTKTIFGLTVAAATLIFTYGTLQAAGSGPVAVSPVKSGEVVTLEPQSIPVKFTVGIGTGYLTGESTELVYWPQFNNHKASELTWKIDNLFMVGVTGSLEVSDWFIANFDGWFKVTDGDGTMDDYDWTVVGADWTDWSHHEDTDVTDGSIIDVNANFAYYRSDNIAFTAIVGFKRDNFGWDAKGGDYVYSDNGFRNNSGSFEDGSLGISYEQTMTSLYGGLGFIADFSNSFKFSGRVIYSPFVDGEATDNNYYRSLVTYDDFEDGDLIAFDLAGTYYFKENFSMELMFSYQKYDTMQGDSEWQFHDEGVVYYLENGAGMDQSSTMISAAVQYTF